MSQHMDALAKGNALRLRRAELRGEVRKDWRVARDALLDPQDWIMGMRLHLLLGSVERIGHAKLSKMCRDAGVTSIDRHIGDLTDRQLEALAEGLSRTMAAREALRRRRDRRLGVAA